VVLPDLILDANPFLENEKFGLGNIWTCMHVIG
jgi:hypothetical protein